MAAPNEGGGDPSSLTFSGDELASLAAGLTFTLDDLNLLPPGEGKSGEPPPPIDIVKVTSDTTTVNAMSNLMQTLDLDFAFRGGGSSSAAGPTATSPMGKERTSSTLSPRPDGASMVSSASMKGSRQFIETHELRRGLNEDGNKTINRYVVLASLGSGAYGKVKLAVDRETEAPYAIKIMNKSMLGKVQKCGGKSALDGVLTEVVIMKKLDHPNVIHLYELIDDPQNNKMFLVLEYAENGPIMSMSGKAVPISIPKLKKYLLAITSGLYYLHRNNVIHRDIKPENILLTSDDVPKLTDFGVSHFVGESSASTSPSPSASTTATTSSSSIAANDAVTAGEGTPAFLSPEACAGGVVSGRACDIWALGITFYYLAFVKLPFNGASVQEIYASILNEPLVVPEQSDPLLRELLQSKIIVKDPAKRCTLEKIVSDPFLADVLEGQTAAQTMAQWNSVLCITMENTTEEERKQAVRVGNNVQLTFTDSVFLMMKLKKTMGSHLSRIKSKLQSTRKPSGDLSPNTGDSSSLASIPMLSPGGSASASLAAPNANATTSYTSK